MLDLVKTICEVIDNNTTREITVIDIQSKTDIADYFIITTGKSTQQVKTLAENVEDQLEARGISVLRKEGISDGRWAILDYGDVMVHFFNDEMKLFYCLEDMWSDGTNIVKYRSEE